MTTNKQIYYSLWEKLMEDLKEYDQSFQYYSKGNSLLKKIQILKLKMK